MGGSGKRLLPKSKPKIPMHILLSTICAIAGVVIALFSYRQSVVDSKKNEILSKPVLNISVQYADEDSMYLDTVLVEATSPVPGDLTIDVEPYLNIIFYLPNERSLLTVLLPIYDLEQIDVSLMPYDFNKLNSSSGTIASISLNDNSRKIIQEFTSLCSSLSYQQQYTKKLPDIFGNYILTSISFEFYIIVDYHDALGNPYQESYLCNSGYHAYTGNLFNFLFAPTVEENVDDSIIEYNSEHAVIYTKLKTYMNNMNLQATVDLVPPDDIMFNDFYDYCQKRISSADSIYYSMGISNDIFSLSNRLLQEKSLTYILGLENTFWKKWV